MAKAVASKRKHFEANASKRKQSQAKPSRNIGIQEQGTIATTAAACAQGEQYNSDFADCIQRYEQIDRDTQKNEKKSQTLKERQSQSTPSNPAQPTVTRSNPPKDKDKDKNKDKDKDIPTTAAVCAQGSSRFTPPTPDEVTAYCQERHNGIDGKEFCVSSKAAKNIVGLTFSSKCGIL